MNTNDIIRDLDIQLAQEEEMAEEALPEVKQAWKKANQGSTSAPDKVLKFSLALLLMKSRNRTDNENGIKLLNELIYDKYHIEDCLYSKVVGLYRMGRFDESRRECEMLLRRDPDHIAANRLHACLLHKISQRDRAVGVSTFIGISIAAVGMAAAVLLSSKRR